LRTVADCAAAPPAATAEKGEALRCFAVAGQPLLLRSVVCYCWIHPPGGGKSRFGMKPALGIWLIFLFDGLRSR
jgi:hypothetical protein